MPLRIFDVDPDAAPRQYDDDVVGRFRSGAQVNGRPLALEEWRITTGDPDVADAVAEAFGGQPEEWETESEERLEVYTDAQSVEVILSGPDAVRSGMALWGRNGGRIRECDGVTQKPTDDGQPGAPCACPSTVRERKAAAKAGTGCEPSLSVYFRLADLPELGRFRFFSGSWSFAGDIGKVEDALAKIGGPASATLGLKRITYTMKGGPRAGQEASFVKPYITVHGPADDYPAPDGEG